MPEVEQVINNYSNQTNKVLLIDLENCPTQLEYLQKDLEQFAQVVICYAKTGAKIPLDWLLPLSSTINSGKLKIFKDHTFRDQCQQDRGRIKRDFP